MFINVMKGPIFSLKLLWNLLEGLASLQNLERLAQRVPVKCCYEEMHQHKGILMKNNLQLVSTWLGIWGWYCFCPQWPSVFQVLLFLIVLDRCFSFVCFTSLGFLILDFKVNFWLFFSLQVKGRTPEVYEKWCHLGRTRKQPLKLPMWE